ncbi:hypothetical protein EV359DRAFT_68138 [Lentinula novae-zelandiae]|nr:hypothetical protein EV359DRAFT_68138 [Lentinula novae-zelandiae]
MRKRSFFLGAKGSADGPRPLAQHPPVKALTKSSISVLVTRSTSLSWEYKFAGQIPYNTLVLHPNPFVIKKISNRSTYLQTLPQLILVAYAAPLDMLTINSSPAVQSWAISKKSVNIKFVDPTTGKRRLPVSKSTIEPSVVRTWLRTAFAENYDFFDHSWKTVFENGFNGTEAWQGDPNGVFTIKFKGIGNGLCYKNWCTMNVDQQGHGTVSPV